jgi:dolichyl-phosphate-mannose-protein mannosyltransferase
MASLAAYVSTLSSTVVGGDSGELIVAARVLGVVHPPGYPLYTLLGRMFTLLPWETVAWRVNLLSAVCDSLAAGLLCHAVSRWTKRPWCGLLAAGLFAFSSVVWPYAVTAEVFPLNNLFAAALLDLSVAASLAPGRWLPIVALTAALGLTNHHTLVFFAGPVLAYVLFLERDSLTARRLAVAAAAFAMGLLPYAYLPLAAASRPPLVWGDQTTWSGFLTHLLRREYGTFQLASADVGQGGQALPRVLDFLRCFTNATVGAGPLLLLAALPSFRRRSASACLGLFWVATLIFYVTVFSILANVRLDEPLHVTVQERFWQQALLIGCALAGVGLATLAGVLGSTAASFVEPAVALGMSAALVATNARAMDRRDDWLFRDYGAAVLRSLPPDAILLITSDEAIGSVRYLQQIEGLRRDVAVIPSGQLASPWFRPFAAHHLPAVTLPSGEFTARQFIDANTARPIVLVNRIPWLQTLEEAYHVWPVGFADRVLPKGEEPEIAAWSRNATATFRSFDPAPAARFPAGSWERYLVDGYWRQYRRFARTLVSVAAARSANPEVHRAIAAGLEALAGADPEPEQSLFKNLGAAYLRLSTGDAEASRKMAFYWRRYLATNPTGDPDREKIRQLVEQAQGEAR